MPRCRFQGPELRPQRWPAGRLQTGPGHRPTLDPGSLQGRHENWLGCPLMTLQPQSLRALLAIQAGMRAPPPFAVLVAVADKVRASLLAIPGSNSRLAAFRPVARGGRLPRDAPVLAGLHKLEHGASPMSTQPVWRAEFKPVSRRRPRSPAEKNRDLRESLKIGL